MNYEAAILYTMQRMREIGRTPDQYHFEPIRIVRTYFDLYAGKIIIHAYNELYILIKAEKHHDLLFVADNTVYNCNSPYKSGVPEFTGKIQLVFVEGPPTSGTVGEIGGVEITPATLLKVEFLRVVY